VMLEAALARTFLFPWWTRRWLVMPSIWAIIVIVFSHDILLSTDKKRPDQGRPA
jgi:hypothetical protein